MVLGSVERAGFWAQLMYMTPWNIQPIIKHEQYDPNTDDENSTSATALSKVTTFGFNYFFNDWTRLQLNYLYKAEEEHEVANDELIMQLQVKF